MEEQKGFFGLLDKYLMGPMSVIAQFKVVRAITAAGMMKAVLALLTAFKLVTTDSQSYQIVNFMADSRFRTSLRASNMRITSIPFSIALRQNCSTTSSA